MKSGKALRDKAIEKTLKKSSGWIQEAVLVVMDYCDVNKGRLVRWEEVRAYVSSRIGDPHHPNVWGALSMKCIRGAKLFKDVYKTTHATDPVSHACRVPVWQVL